MSDEYMEDEQHDEEDGEYFKEEPQSEMDEQQQAADAEDEPASSSMAHLERRKQREARQFSTGLLASLMPSGSGSGTAGDGQPGVEAVHVKQEATESEDVQQPQQEEQEYVEMEQNEADEAAPSPPAVQAEQDAVDGGEDEQQYVGEDGPEQYVMRPAEREVRNHSLKINESFVHEVFYPRDQEMMPLRSATDEPAKQFDFKLDPFQKEGIKVLENNRSIVVSAHTSAGKTAIAHYAIARALRHKNRVIYTTPIKSLSNQKYKELSEVLNDVGLSTGDVTIKPGAPCMVMTMEILRNKLYKNANLNDVEWIIFDEIHYIQDKERGIVWEESIILLPSHIRFVFLSATIPNAKEFAQWIAYVHQQPCHLICTLTRPIPLHHFIMPNGAEKLYQVIAKDKFKSVAFDEAMEFLLTINPNPNVNNFLNQQPKRGAAAASEAIARDTIRKVIRTINERHFLPCLVFSFSRKECEQYMVEVKQMDFNTEAEKATVLSTFRNAIDLLAEEEKQLPQARSMLPFLLRGIGIHHSGMLPTMKEIVEMLFARGLVKVLFATETFAMGVNMPAKSVLFTSAKKFDGTESRWITPGEYAQMSGRAGRRGMDERGMVVLMMDQLLTQREAEELMMGKGDPLRSQFRLTSNMLLNQIKLNTAMPNTVTPDKMVKKSFLQWQARCAMPELAKELNEKRTALASTHVEHELELAQIRDLEQRILALKRGIRERIMTPTKVVPFFQPGRLMKMKHLDKDYDWGILVDWKKVKNPLDSTSNEMIYILQMAVLISAESERRLPNLAMVRPPVARDPGVLAVIPFTFECIQEISACRLKLPEELKSKEARQAVASYIWETKKRFKNEIPLLHPFRDLLVADEKVRKDWEDLEENQQKLANRPLKRRHDYDTLSKLFEQKQKMVEDVEQAEKRHEEGKKLQLQEELAARLKVLEQLTYITRRQPQDTDEEEGEVNEQDVAAGAGQHWQLLSKGSVACELTSGDELVLTEMLFTNSFNELEPAEIAASLSCFVFDERAPPQMVLAPRMELLYRNIQSHAKKVAQILHENGVLEGGKEESVAKYVERFGPGMMDSVYKWCTGARIGELLNGTQIFEGSIIRCMRRLEQLLREMEATADSLDQGRKFGQARDQLKRGIPFADSIHI